MSSAIWSRALELRHNRSGAPDKQRNGGVPRMNLRRCRREPEASRSGNRKGSRNGRNRSGPIRAERSHGRNEVGELPLKKIKQSSGRLRAERSAEKRRFARAG